MPSLILEQTINVQMVAHVETGQEPRIILRCFLLGSQTEKTNILRCCCSCWVLAGPTLTYKTVVFPTNWCCVFDILAMQLGSCVQAKNYMLRVSTFPVISSVTSQNQDDVDVSTT